MEISATTLGRVPLLIVTGDIDHFSALRLKQAAAASGWTGGGFLLDLAGCPYLDSGGLSVLLGVLAKMGPDQWLGVIGADANVRRMFEMIGLRSSPRFVLFDSTQEASRFIAGRLAG